MQITFCHTPYAGNRVDIGSYLNHIQFPYVVDAKIDMVKSMSGISAFNFPTFRNWSA